MTAEALTPFEGQDIRTLIDSQGERRGAHPFLIWEPFEGEGRTWSYSQFADAVRRFAAGLRARGIEPNDRVLVHLDNCPESIISWLGCAYAGAVAVTTNARSSGDEISYFAEHSGAVAAITQPKFAELVRGSATKVKWLAVTDTDNGAPAERTHDAERFSAIDGDPAALATRPHRPMAHFSIQYTSGTTARPKAVLWTHANALWGARVCAMHEDLRPDDINLVFFPTFHTAGQVYSILASFWTGATAVLQPRFSASRFWPISLKHRCTWAAMLPFAMKAILDLPVPKNDYRLWGMSIDSPPVAAKFGIKIMGWWGMTETITQGIIGSPHQPNTPLSMGRPSPMYEVFILDDAGEPVKPGETGNLYIRGRRGVSLFLEYANDPVATAAAFRDDGLFITGDRARLGEDGALFFGDRVKDMLRVGGENVAASEIERVILTVAGVSEVAVVAKRHPMLDEVPVAFVIPVSADDLSLSERIMMECQKMLATFKHPREVRIVPDLPRSTNQKIAKAKLRELVKDQG